MVALIQTQGFYCAVSPPDPCTACFLDNNHHIDVYTLFTPPIATHKESRLHFVYMLPSRVPVFVCSLCTRCTHAAKNSHLTSKVTWRCVRCCFLNVSCICGETEKSDFQCFVHSWPTECSPLLPIGRSHLFQNKGIAEEAVVVMKCSENDGFQSVLEL